MLTLEAPTRGTELDSWPMDDQTSLDGEPRPEPTADELRGMFAYALWDQGRRRLVLARDHSGIKPMYFALSGAGALVFAAYGLVLALLGGRLVARRDLT